MKYGYYPGCSLEKNAIAYHQSTLATMKLFGVELAEIEDWNCCGTSEYISIDLYAANALIARNLALAANQPDNCNQIVAPCSLCYLNLSKTEYYLLQSPELEKKIDTALAAGGLTYKAGNMNIRHILDIIVNDISFSAIEEKVTNPLRGLRVAPYYGCLIVRPGFDKKFDDHEYPTSMDKLMNLLGVQVVDFPLKTHCCGGHMTQISENVAFELIRRLLKNAADYEADVIATICPMCQLNLDAYQMDVNKYFKSDFKIPILYFTQLMGLALGLSAEELGIGKEFVDARPALAKIGVDVRETEPPMRKRPPKEELPMPRMLEEV